MPLKEDIVNFLTTNPHIDRLNFNFSVYKVYPDAYRKDVAEAIRTGEIKIRIEGASSPEAGASYDMNYDSLELSPSFTTATWRDQAFLVHECTHAHLDIQNFGKHNGHQNEAVGYLAEAVFLEASGNSPLGSETIRVVSHRIAKGILAGTYYVSRTDATNLVGEVAKHQHYAAKAYYNSNGFNRSLVHKLLR